MKTLPTFLALIVLLLLSGCEKTHRFSVGQAQALSNAQVGTEALVEASDSATKSELAKGVSAYLVAAFAKLKEPLPVPQFSKEYLKTAEGAHLYREAAEQAKSNPPEGAGWAWAGVGATALAGVGFLLRIGRNVPGIAGIACGLANSAYEYFASDKLKEEEAKVQKATAFAVHFGHAVSTIAGTDPRLAAMVETVKGQAGGLAKRLGVESLIIKALEDAKTGNPLLSGVEVSAPVTQPK
jgi:hypothetical protein